MAPSPLFSVVVPVYNRSDTVARAIRSAFEQTVDDLEVLVVDDGSTDESADVARRMRPPAGSTLHVIESGGRLGAGAARNIGIDAASGRFLAFLDSDDQWEPAKLETQLRELEGGGRRLALAGFLRHQGNTVRLGVPGVLDEPDTVGALLGSSGGPLTCSVMALPTGAARNAGIRFDQAFPALQDLDFAVCAARAGFEFVGEGEPPLVRKFRDPLRDHVFNPRNEVQARRLLLTKYAAEYEERPHLRLVQRRKLALAVRSLQRLEGSTATPPEGIEDILREGRAGRLNEAILRAYAVHPRLGDVLLRAGANQDRAGAAAWWRWARGRVSDVADDVRRRRRAR